MEITSGFSVLRLFIAEWRCRTILVEHERKFRCERMNGDFDVKRAMNEYAVQHGLNDFYIESASAVIHWVDSVNTLEIV